MPYSTRLAHVQLRLDYYHLESNLLGNICLFAQIPPCEPFDDKAQQPDPFAIHGQFVSNDASVELCGVGDAVDHKLTLADHIDKRKEPALAQTLEKFKHAKGKAAVVFLAPCLPCKMKADASYISE